MPSVSPSGNTPTGSTTNSSREHSSSAFRESTEFRVNSAAQRSLSQNQTDDSYSSSGYQELKVKLDLLEEQFKKIDDTYTTKSGCDLTDQAENFQSCLLNHLVDGVLKHSKDIKSTESRESETTKTGPEKIANLLEGVVISSINIWQLNSGIDRDFDLVRDFDYIKIGSLIDNLVRLNSNYSLFDNEVKLLLDVQDIQKRLTYAQSQQFDDLSTPNSSRSQIQKQGRSDSIDSGCSVDSNLAKRAENFRNQHAHVKQPLANDNKLEGDKRVAISQLCKLVGEAPVVVLGEGDHGEFALDSIITDSKLPEQLYNAGLRTVVAEHVYPEHVKEIDKLDCSRVFKHLSEKAFGNQSKALNYLQFLRVCIQNGINVLAADTKEIYRPPGSINRYNETDRIELLNENIVSLHNTHKEEGKMLVILGAAHSNSLNAKASRAQMPEEIKPKYDTPGVSQIIPSAREMIVITKRSSEAAEIPLHSIGEGVVFKIEV